MKNKILTISSKKLPSGFQELSNDFVIISEKNIIKAYKSIFTTTPDIILLNTADSVFESYHFLKLLTMIPETQNIPVILITGKKALPSGIDFNSKNKIAHNADYWQIITIIDDTLKASTLKESHKTKISQIKPSAAQIKSFTSEILDEILISSSINEEFKPLIENMNFENVLAENIFKILAKYIPYDAAGLFFNNSDETKRNVLNFSLPNNNVPVKTVDEMSSKFFDEIEKYKTVNEIQCNLINGDTAERGKLKYDEFKKVVILPYKYCGCLSGGIIIAMKKQPDIYQNAFLKIITRELNVIFNLKYMFNEQENRSVYDTMTGLFNRQEFEANLDKEFHRARRYIFNFTLAMLDIDYLSKINESYGKSFGDFVIKELSKLLQEVFRRTDLIYRYGGEEIIVLLPSTPITKSIIPIERLRSKIAEHVFEKDGIKTNITVSVGLCANYSKFTAPEQLLDAVGTALLRAKDGGRNKVDIFE